MPFANNNGVKIHYEVEGQGPPLVLQHGLTSSLEVWRDNNYVSALGKENLVILVDARGHGTSDKPYDPGLYTPWAFASDIMAVLDSLEIEKAGYWGYSMGGAIGYHGIARYAPKRFNYLIIGGMSPYSSEVERREWQNYAFIMQLGVDEGTEAYVTFLEKKNGIPFPKPRRDRLLANDPLALAAAARSLLNWPGADDILPGISSPCLIYAGESDGFYSGAKKAAAVIPEARFISFPGLNHPQVYLRSDLVLPHARKFLADVNNK